MYYSTNLWNQCDPNAQYKRKKIYMYLHICPCMCISVCVCVKIGGIGYSDKITCDESKEQFSDVT